MILLTGATGNTGQVVAQMLRQRGVNFRVMARSLSAKRKLESQGYAVVEGDFDDPERLPLALEGISKAYLVCTPDENLVRRETAFISAARAARVDHIVKCSAFLASPAAPSQNLRSHAEIEQVLIQSGIGYTIVRPHGFMQTFVLAGWDLITRASVLMAPCGNGGLPVVDIRDVASVVVKTLTEPGHVGKTYDLTGPRSLTMTQMADEISRKVGRKITYVPATEREFNTMLNLMGVPEVPAEHAKWVMKAIREHLFEECANQSLADLNLIATDFSQFLSDLLQGRTGGGNSFQPPATLKFKMLNAMMPLVMKLRVLMRRTT